MRSAAQRALALWGLEGATCALAAQRENTVWHVTHEGAQYALRFHRPGYRSVAELRSELIWMSHLAQQGVRLPSPIVQPGGGFLGTVGDHHVSLLTWLPGCPIGAVGELHDIADPVALCRDLGRAMAQLHDLSDAWQRPDGFVRPDWRLEGLLGETPLWGRFWDHPDLDDGQRRVLLRMRAVAADALARIDKTADQGLIHADLLAENILRDGVELAFIDFDDGAFGYRDFELATFLMKFRHRPDYEDLRAALCEGYQLRRRVEPDQLDLFVVLRALTYPGWIMSRLSEPGAAERSRRAVSAALDLSLSFLERSTP